MEETYNEFVPQVHFEQIPIKNLVSNQEYQRSLSLAHVGKTTENFDPFQINPVKVSRRDGINYVFNGQHTIEIVAQASGSRDTPVWCMIYDALIYEHEASIFAEQQKYVKHLKPYEIFMANIEAKSEKHLIIRDIVESYNLKISIAAYLGGICAVSTLEKIYDTYGFHVLDRTLRIIVGTWEGIQQSFSANMLNGVAKLVVTYEDKLLENIFKEKVGLIPLKEIFRSARERGGGAVGYAETLLYHYNLKNTRQLSRKKLYENKKKDNNQIAL